MFSRHGRKLVTVLALLGGILSVLQSPRPVMAQAQTWTTPAWYIGPAEVKAYFRTEYFRDKSALKAPNPGGEQVKQIKRLVHNFLSQLTQENKTNLPRVVVERLLPDLHFASTTTGARTVAMDEIIAIAPDLLTFPDDLVRYNLISIIVQLTMKSGQIQNGVEIPAVPFNPAYRVLLSVIQNQNEILACRILAARGLLRICRDGENAPSSNEKSDIATAVIAALNANPSSSADGVWWFRHRLIQVLGAVDRIDNSATQPIVVEALMDVITDTNEVWMNRAAAAQSISQLPYSASTNVPLITSEILNLLVELSNEFNRAPNAPDLREPFKHIYLSFRPALQRQAKERKWGLLYEVERPGLAAHAPYVKGAMNVAMPILRPFMQVGSVTDPVPPISNADLENLENWIAQNPPASRSITPTGKVYPAKADDAKAAATPAPANEAVKK